MNPKIKDVAGGNRSRMGGVVSFLVQEKNEIIIYLFGNNLVASFANGIDAKLVIIIEVSSVFALIIIRRFFILFLSTVRFGSIHFN